MWVLYPSHVVLTGKKSRYPKLASLLREKHALHSSPTYSIPPTYLSMSPSDALLALPPVRFDAILLSPPGTVSFEELQKLDMGRVAASPGFVWLWVGSGARGDGIGLERGRELIANWGYRWAPNPRPSSFSDAAQLNEFDNLQEMRRYSVAKDEQIRSSEGPGEI